MAREVQGNLRCSFCDKIQYEVGKLVAGPTAYICDQCIASCLDIFEDDHRIQEVRITPLQTFLKTRLAGRPVDALTVGDIITAYRAATAFPAPEKAPHNDLGIAPLTETEHAEIRAHSERIHLPAIDLGGDTVDPELAKLFPPELSERYSAVIVHRGTGRNGPLVVAMAEPGTQKALEAIDDIKFITNYSVEVVLAHSRQIREVIARVYL